MVLGAHSCVSSAGVHRLQAPGLGCAAGCRGMGGKWRCMGGGAVVGERAGQTSERSVGDARDERTDTGLCVLGSWFLGLGDLGRT